MSTMDQRDRHRLEDALECAASYKAERDSLLGTLRDLDAAGRTAWQFQHRDTNAALGFASALTKSRIAITKISVTPTPVFNFSADAGDGATEAVAGPQPATVDGVPEALDWFWNAALTATHAYSDPTANAVMDGIVSGVAAVANALREQRAKAPFAAKPEGL